MTHIKPEPEDAPEFDLVEGADSPVSLASAFAALPGWNAELSHDADAQVVVFACADCHARTALPVEKWAAFLAGQIVIRHRCRLLLA